MHFPPINMLLIFPSFIQIKFTDATCREIVDKLFIFKQENAVNPLSVAYCINSLYNFIGIMYESSNVIEHH